MRHLRTDASQPKTHETCPSALEQAIANSCQLLRLQEDYISCRKHRTVSSCAKLTPERSAGLVKRAYERYVMYSYFQKFRDFVLGEVSTYALRSLRARSRSGPIRLPTVAGHDAHAIGPYLYATQDAVTPQDRSVPSAPGPAGKSAGSRAAGSRSASRPAQPAQPQKQQRRHRKAAVAEPSTAALPRGPGVLQDLGAETGGVQVGVVLFL